MAEPQYQRLTRERTPRRFAVAITTRSSLWLGGDHLLLVECTGYTETYKRFYFRDIQAITLRQTQVRAVWNWILGIILGLCMLGMVGILAKGGPGIGVLILLGIELAVFGIPLLLNNLFGATCACEIRTAVQTGELSSIVRLRQARRVFDKIRPFIVTAQGELTAVDISARMQEASAAEAPAQLPEPPAAGIVPPVIS